MDKELKAKWVRALRSGRYAQGFGVLKEDGNGGYCCLGVLANVAKIDCDLTLGFLYGEDAAFVGLAHQHQKALAKLNDDEVPFDVIAGLIDHAL